MASCRSDRFIGIVFAAGLLAHAPGLATAAESRSADGIGQRLSTAELARRLPGAAAVLRQRGFGSGLLWDNGPFVTNENPKSSVAESRLQDLSVGTTEFGFSHDFSAGTTVTDDFVVDGDGWDIEAIALPAFQEGSGIDESTVTDVRVRIWDGPPNDPGSNIVYGDFDDNLLLVSGFTGIYRTSETAPYDESDPQTQQRPLMISFVLVETFLEPGTYWLEWYSEGTLEPDVRIPALTIEGVNVPGNALQSNDGSYAPALDNGANQDFPFAIFGSGADPALLDCPGWTEELGSWNLEGGDFCGNYGSTATTAKYESISRLPIEPAAPGEDFYYVVDLAAYRPTQPTAANTIFVGGNPTPLQTAAQWWHSGIAFNFAANGKYSIFRYNGSAKPIALQGWTTPVGNPLNGSGGLNTLAVERFEGDFYFYVNDVLVKTMPGFALSGEHVGVGMVRSVPGTAGHPATDTLDIYEAYYYTGCGCDREEPRQRQLSSAQAQANDAANRDQARPDPFFAPADVSGSRN